MSNSDAIPVVVKWGKETLSLTLCPSQGVKALKSNLHEATNVPLERMKLMPKSKGLWKGLLKDDFDLTSIEYSKIKTPITFLLMGSAAKLTEPKVKTIFVEDLKPEEAAKVAPEPSGLNNLGNTCYLNSVLQCLRPVKVFRNALTDNAANPNGASSSSSTAGVGVGAGNNNTNNPATGALLRSLNDTYRSLDSNVNAISPTSFVMSTKMAFPQFAQTGPQGQPMQQDAEEFLSGLLTMVSQAGGMQGKDAILKAFQSGNSGNQVKEEELEGIGNLVDALFGIQMEETYTCDEYSATAGVGDLTSGLVHSGGSSASANSTDLLEAEPAVVRYDLHRKLVCNIQGGSDANSQTNVTHIMEGIALSLNGKVEKHSELLNRDAIWTRRQRLSRLPQVLCVQFGRFYWKETPDSQDHAGVKCKVMKPVAFNSELDVFDFCSDKVKSVLKKSRDQALKEEEDRIAKKLKGEDVKEDTTSNDVEMENADENEEDGDLQAALAMSMATEEEQENGNDVIVGPGLPKDFQGKYELFAIVTHKGRDADGGHYMGWVKAEHQDNSSKIADTDEDNEDWFVFDDDEVSPCKTEDVLKLKGGGDWHMSYLNFYRAKK